MAPPLNTASGSHLPATAARALADGASLRAVRHAHLMLAPGTSAFTAQAALEDALRTADFADAGRLILVRQLSLKGLPRGATGPQIARALEHAWQSLAPHAVPFDAPGAAQAQVVFFRSVHDARLAWLDRFAQGRPTDAWFWPRALPELAGQGRGVASEVLIALLAQLQASAPAALALQLQAQPVDALHRLLDALPASAPASLAAALPPADPAGRTQPWPAGAAAEDAASAALHPGEAQALAAAAGPDAPMLPLAVARAASSWPAYDWRVRWLVALVLYAQTGVPARAAHVARALAGAQRAAAPARGWPQAATGEGADPAAGPRAPHAQPSATSWPLEATAPGLATARMGPGPHPGPAPRDEAPQIPRPPSRKPLLPPRLAMAFPWLAAGQDTQHGGLLMLLNALAVLRFPAWLERQPALVRQHGTRALLAHLARRLHLPPDDPQQALLALPPAVQRALQAARCNWAGFAWPRGLGAQGLGPAGDSTAQALACWRRALVRLLRRHAGIGLVALVRRAASIVVTPTHVDVVLPLAQADVALRRVGVDSDPGWLPWFGWIVGFHYVGLPEVLHAG